MPVVGQASLQSARVKRELREVRPQLSSWPEHFIFSALLAVVSMWLAGLSTQGHCTSGQGTSLISLSRFMYFCARVRACVCV